MQQSGHSDALTVVQEDIVLGKKLASGGFGTVYRGDLVDEDDKERAIIVKKVT